MRTAAGSAPHGSAASATSPSEHEGDGAARAPAREPEPGGHAADRHGGGGVGAERHGERGGGGGAHRRVEPRQPADRAAADEHEHRGGDGGERAGGDRARLRLARQRGRAGGCQREGEHGSRARHGPPGDDRARARDGPRHEEGARDRVHEHSGILAYGMPWIQPTGRE